MTAEHRRLGEQAFRCAAPPPPRARRPQASISAGLSTMTCLPAASAAIDPRFMHGVRQREIDDVRVALAQGALVVGEEAALLRPGLGRLAAFARDRNLARWRRRRPLRESPAARRSRNNPRISRRIGQGVRRDEVRSTCHGLRNGDRPPGDDVEAAIERVLSWTQHVEHVVLWRADRGPANGVGAARPRDRARPAPPNCCRTRGIGLVDPVPHDVRETARDTPDGC